jgi:hypothetical protein
VEERPSNPESAAEEPAATTETPSPEQIATLYPFSFEQAMRREKAETRPAAEREPEADQPQPATAEVASPSEPSAVAEPGDGADEDDEDDDATTEPTAGADEGDAGEPPRKLTSAERRRLRAERRQAEVQDAVTKALDAQKRADESDARVKSLEAANAERRTHYAQLIGDRAETDRVLREVQSGQRTLTYDEQEALNLQIARQDFVAAFGDLIDENRKAHWGAVALKLLEDEAHLDPETIIKDPSFDAVLRHAIAATRADEQTRSTAALAAKDDRIAQLEQQKKALEVKVAGSVPPLEMGGRSVHRASEAGVWDPSRPPGENLQVALRRREGARNGRR